MGRVHWFIIRLGGLWSTALMMIGISSWENLNFTCFQVHLPKQHLFRRNSSTSGIGCQANRRLSLLWHLVGACCTEWQTRGLNLWREQIQTNSMYAVVDVVLEYSFDATTTRRPWLRRTQPGACASLPSHLVPAQAGTSHPLDHVATGAHQPTGAQRNSQ